MPSEVVTQIQDNYFDTCPLCEEVTTTKGSRQLFLKSVSVWINKPHVVNRRLCGSKIIDVVRVFDKDEAVSVVEKFKSFYDEKRNVGGNDVNFTDLVGESNLTTQIIVVIRELIPKSEFFPKYIEAVIYDKQRVQVTFIPIVQDCIGKIEDLKPTNELHYQFELTSEELSGVNKIKLSWLCDHSESEQIRRQVTSKWLRSILIEKLVSLSQVNNLSTSVTSLQLVDVDKYKNTYTRLKNTYGRELVKNWTECTDPKKFVYEDVAIAAYLLLIWEEDRKVKNLQHKQSFVDLGCGNGLLVYILTKEGHKGVGFDLRKRKIWDTFGPDIELREKTIIPSADYLYPEFDWIIGNHSDELTPWIPVIAARSSYNTCFFLLPCCPHDFNCKFSTIDKRKSRYGSYIDYVRDITVVCGFTPESDTLRIPSTKRVCFIGRKRSYAQNNELQEDTKRWNFIEKRTSYNKGVKKQTELNIENCTNKSSSLLANNIDDNKQVSIMRNNDHAVTEIPRQEESAENLKDSCSDTENDLINSLASSSKDSSSSNGSGKRKHEMLGSLDSGFYEAELSDDDKHTSTKHFKSTCSNDDVHDSDNCQTEYGSLDSNSTISLPTPHELNISLKNNCNTLAVNSQEWVKDFQPRVEPGIRNCQNVPEQVKLEIVQKVFAHVLAAPDSRNVVLNSGKTWRKGGSVTLSEVVTLFDKPLLQKLKSEFGGLQTLLRNHSHIFQESLAVNDLPDVVNSHFENLRKHGESHNQNIMILLVMDHVTGGYVQLRDFTTADPWIGRSLRGKNKRGNQLDTRKTTLCWFYTHHPNGCPQTNDVCKFAHGVEELRAKPVREKVSFSQTNAGCAPLYFTKGQEPITAAYVPLCV